MTSLSYLAVVKALDADVIDPEQVYAAAEDLAGAFVRHEHLIGLLPADAPRLMVRAYEVAGEGGVSEAYVNLAKLYRTGGTFGSPCLPKDPRRAIELYRLAENQGANVSLLIAQTAYRADLREFADEAASRVTKLVDAARAAGEPEDRRTHAHGRLLPPAGLWVCALGRVVGYGVRGRGWQQATDIPRPWVASC